LLLSLSYGPVTLRPKEQSELKRHIESGELWNRIQFRSTEIVNTKGTFADELYDFIDPSARRIIDLKRASCNKAAARDRKNNSIKKRLVSWIKWTVDKDGFLTDCPTGHRSRPRLSLSR
jgi:hypothetical protein